MDVPVTPAMARPVLGSSSQTAVSKAIYQAGQPPPSSAPTAPAPARSPRGTEALPAALAPPCPAAPPPQKLP